MKNDKRKRGKRLALISVLCAALIFSSVSVLADANTTSGGSSATVTAEGETPPGGGGEGGGAGGGTPPDGNGGGGGGADTMTYDYSGTVSGTLTADGEEITSDGETISSDTADVNAALSSNGGTLTITNGTLTKSGDDTNGDNCNFYGVNSIALSVGEGSTMYLQDSSLSAESEGSNGIFATDSGTVYAYHDTITTTAGNSRGLDATYGGTIIASAMTITTSGDHCAAVATDRGGGSISVTDSTLTTAGSGSPLLYSTGDIEVDGVTGTSSGSQIAGMEGLNTILIYHSDLTSTITSATASDPVADGIIIYQSTSGDAESTTGETAVFQAVNSKLTSAIESGSMFYVTNTTANILLKNTELNFDSDAANLLYIAGNDSNNWGTSGSNGGTVTFTAMGEDLSGDITVDTISSLDLYLLDQTSWSGAAVVEENASGSTSDDVITVNVGSDSTWVVTADSTVTNLNVADGGQVVDAEGKTVTIVANGSAVVEGDSDLTVTVTGSYGTEVTTSDANEVSADLIDRTTFDAYYGTETAFDTEGTAAEGTTEESASSESSSEAVTSDESSEESLAEESEDSADSSEMSEEVSGTADETDQDESNPAAIGIALVVIIAVIGVVAALIIKARNKN